MVGMKNLIRQTNWLWAATIITVVYFIGLGWLIGPNRIDTFFIEGDLNEVGDFLAGAFSPLAFIWLVAAVLTQRQELDETRDQFAANQLVVDEQLSTINSQDSLLSLQHTQAQESARQTYRLNLFDKRFEIFKDLNDFRENAKGVYGSGADDVFTNIRLRSEFVFKQEIVDWIDEISEAVTVAVEKRIDLRRRTYNSVAGEKPYYEWSEEERAIGLQLNNIDEFITSNIERHTLMEKLWSSMRVSDD